MSEKHANISIFVPHIGCPNRCSFCDQRSITGSCKAPNANDVISAVETAANSKGYNPKTTEIAFFGGSFTAINRNYMLGLLQAAYSFVENGTVSGIRISTRPDAIDTEILSILKAYGVTAIELGAQSMNDDVLRLNNRGHCSEDIVKASNMIKNAGFELGLQMMTGLYGDSDETALETARKIAQIAPKTVRIYPTIVLKKTDLAVLYLDKKYEPQSLDSAVLLSAKLLKFFEEKGIKVIRLGLHSIEKNSYLAGPWHPAFSELCYSQIYFENALLVLSDKGNYNIYVNDKEISKMIGQNRSNIDKLKALGYQCRVLPSSHLLPYEVKTERTV